MVVNLMNRKRLGLKKEVDETKKFHNLTAGGGTRAWLETRQGYGKNCNSQNDLGNSVALFK